MSQGESTPSAIDFGVLRSKLSNVNTVIFPTILCVILLSLFSDKFLTVENQLNILRSASVAMIVGVGQVFVISARQIDLSVGSTLGLVACLTGFFGSRWRTNIHLLLVRSFSRRGHRRS